MNRKARKFFLRAAAITGAVVFTVSVNDGSAKAQMFPGWGSPMAGPTFVPPPPQFMPPPPPFMPPPAFNRPIPVPGIPGGIDPNGRDAWGVGAPAIGAGVTAGMSAYPLTRPFAPWAGERVTANAGSAYRESGVGNQAIRTFTGVSPRDIDTYGWRGGQNSEVNKVLGWFGM